jgi:peptidase E
MSAIRRILATSGGFSLTDRYRVMRPAGLMVEALRLAGKDRPTVCLVMTASSDDAGYLLSSFDAFRGWSVDVTHLRLANQPNADPHELLTTADVVWVGGGSVANLLAVWRVHGVDDAMRAAWEGGTILSGVSAGSICWHIGGPTDSFAPTLQPVTDGLALVPYGNGVHYDSEEQRRPLLHSLVGNGTLPLSYATDDGTGILYEGADAVSVIEDAEGSGKAAYRVELVDGEVVETRLEPGPIS